MTTHEEKSQQRMMRIFGGALVVLCVFGGIIYLGKRTSPVLEDQKDAALEQGLSEKEASEISSLEQQYRELFQALSEDDIPGACALCETILPGLSGDVFSGDSLEREILLLCESAREQERRSKKELLEKTLGALPSEDLLKRLEIYRQLLALEEENRSYKMKARGLEEEIIRKSTQDIESALKAKDFDKACALCEKLPEFLLASPDSLNSLQSLCDTALEERRKARTQAILAKVKPLPSSDYLGNLRGYRELALLDPGKDLYWEKIERYTESAEKAQSRMLRKADARMSYDVNTGTFWYFPDIAEKRDSRSGAHMYVYLGKKDDDTPPKLRLVCLLPRKEFFPAEQLLFSFGNAKYALPLQREWLHFSEGFLWCDLPLPASSEALKLLDAFSKSSKGSFAFTLPGEKQLLGWALSSEELHALRQMLELYKNLGQ